VPATQCPAMPTPGFPDGEAEAWVVVGDFGVVVVAAAGVMPRIDTVPIMVMHPINALQKGKIIS